MNFYKLALVFSMLPTMLILASCSATTGTAGANKGYMPRDVVECPYPGTQIPAPGWICDQKVDGVGVQAVGSAKYSGDFSFDKTIAAQRARVVLANTVSVNLKAMVEDFRAQALTGASASIDEFTSIVSTGITKLELKGSRIFKSIVAPDNTTYVLVGVNEDESKILDDIVAKEAQKKSSLNNENALYQEWKAREALKRLNAETSKY